MTLRVLSWSACLAALCVVTTSAASAAAPNVLLVTADDLGCQLSCYGETRFATPQLDALAAAGVRFERAYVAQSSCSSSRSALLTGRWPHQNGQYGLAHLGFRMHPGQPCLPALLKSAGYRTGIIGKLHVEPAADFPWDWMPAKEKMAAPPTRNVQWVAAQSREFFAAAKASGKPFFYYVNYFDPHGPYSPDVNQVNGLPEKPLQASDLREPYPMRTPNAEAQKRISAAIANTILRADAGMGLLLAELKASGLADNTLVIYLGDNGLPVERGKTYSYEPGVRVPLLVRWPGTTKAGLVRRELVSMIDVMPTILEAAGVALPAGLAGRSLRPLFAEGQPAWREFLFTEMNFHEPQIFRPQRSVCDARYKLLVNLTPQAPQAPRELFDLQTDPQETKNLIDDPALGATRKRLEQALAEWQRTTDDPLLDAARVGRWQAAAEAWGKLPRVKRGPSAVVQIPAGDLERLK